MLSCQADVQHGGGLLLLTGIMSHRYAGHSHDALSIGSKSMYMKKLCVSDWLKMSTFFMQQECKVVMQGQSCITSVNFK